MEQQQTRPAPAVDPSRPGPERGIVLSFRDGAAGADQEQLDELVFLCESCGVEVLAALSQRLQRVDPGTLVGKGKLAELVELAASSGCSCFVFGREVSPTQKRNLEQALGVKVLGRTELILDIFARRARTREARLQVELAQLEYALPRLAGMWEHLGSSQGGVGFRGPGEKQLELDRRTIKTRIANLKRRLAQVRVERGEQRKRRIEKPLVVIVGYTNAGKSTLLGALSGSDVYAADMLFSTLDSTIREVYNPDGRNLLFSDTVGFIRELPHTLVEAFKATLEEIRWARLVLLVVDVGDPRAAEKVETVRRVLAEIGAERKTVLYCFNKADRLDGPPPADLVERYAPSVVISALERRGLAELVARAAELAGADAPWNEPLPD